MKPVVGITSYFVKAYEIDEGRPRGIKGQDMLMSTMDYSTSIEKAGGVPLVIPVIKDPGYIDAIVEKVDGIVLSGGPDIYPLLYDTSIHTNCKRIVATRDRFEFELLKKSLEKNKPIFGICRGFHLLNVFFGGTLYQDIYDDKLSNVAHSGSKATPCEPCHGICFEKNNLFYNIFGHNSIVNSFHHQAIKDLGNGLKAVGWSCEDKLIEAIIHENNNLVFGVQWHPEMMAKFNKKQMNIFEYFIKLIIKSKEANK